MKGAKVLVVEDDPAVLRITTDLLSGDGCEVMTAMTLEEGWTKAMAQPPSLIVLDLQFAQGNGLDFCKRLKADDKLKDCAVFMLTARSASEDIVAGLKVGADDYLAKPFHEQEFLARVEALLRRFQPASPPSKHPGDLQTGKLRISRAARQVWVGEQEIRLTLREFELLYCLAEKEGTAMTREEILVAAWGPQVAVVSKAVDVHMTHLRAKLGAEGKRIKSVSQVGYRMDPGE